MGMPGLSKTKLQAISDSIKEANTSLDEMVKLQNLAKEASAKNWEIDVAQYEKQISDIVRDLNYKIPQEIQNALNKYTVAELEGNLDTID
jgi:Skp family chaperone for outer membrane proteins